MGLWMFQVCRHGKWNIGEGKQNKNQVPSMRVVEGTELFRANRSIGFLIVRSSRGLWACFAVPIPPKDLAPKGQREIREDLQPTMRQKWGE